MTAPRCSHWFLHKSRHTFASNMLPVLGLKKLQLVLEQKDISTTQKYLHLVAEYEANLNVPVDLHNCFKAATAAQRDYQIVREFTDRISAVKARRPGLGDLMRDARRGRLGRPQRLNSRSASRIDG